jgi:hypothetical protein
MKWVALALLLAGSVQAQDVPLKEYVDLRIEEQDRRVEQAQESARAAINKSEDAISERLALLNEFREQSADRDANFARVDQLDAVNARVATLESSRDRIYGAILLIGLIGIANLVKAFGGKP